MIKLKAQLDNFDQDSIRTGLKCLDKSLAQQQFKEDSDINTLVERFHLTGEMPQLTQLPTYQDFDNIFDFQTAMNAIRSANETFMSLPAQLRARFHNDPQEFLAFTSDEQNLPEARKLGILSPEAIAKLDKKEADANALKEQQIIEQHQAKNDKKTKEPKGST